jgi:hypothetical protein
VYQLYIDVNVSKNYGEHDRDDVLPYQKQYLLAKEQDKLEEEFQKFSIKLEYFIQMTSA